MKSPLSLGMMLSALSPGSRVLDLGCGGGTFRYRDFPSLTIHALDDGVHDKVRDFPSNVHFVHAGASAIPEKDGAFDLVVVNFAFEHFPDPVLALREIERVAKDRACVWISMPNAGSFEDQLYRNLFAGGGHLQSPTLERFLRLAYQNTCFKLISFIELPAGFTYLGESEELRHLTWAIIDALRRSVAIDARSRSGYIFVLRKFTEAGPGFKAPFRTCHACGSPDELETEEPDFPCRPWTCRNCGAYNPSPSTLQSIPLDDVERAQRLQWERLPDTHPARLRKLVAERGKWGQELERNLHAERRRTDELTAELDRRGEWAMALKEELDRSGERALALKGELDRSGEWALALQKELAALRDEHMSLQARYADLLSEFDARGRWALELDRTVNQQSEELNRLRQVIEELRRPLGYLKHLWIKLRGNKS